MYLAAMTLGALLLSQAPPDGGLGFSTQSPDRAAEEGNPGTVPPLPSTGDGTAGPIDRVSPTEPGQAGARRPTAAELVADASRFHRDFGWQPQHSDLDSIIRTAWDWLSDWKGI